MRRTKFCGLMESCAPNIISRKNCYCCRVFTFAKNNVWISFISKVNIDLYLENLFIFPVIGTKKIFLKFVQILCEKQGNKQIKQNTYTWNTWSLKTCKNMIVNDTKNVIPIMIVKTWPCWSSYLFLQPVWTLFISTLQTNSSPWQHSKAYVKPCQTPMMELYVRIANNFNYPANICLFKVNSRSTRKKCILLLTLNIAHTFF